MKYITSPSNPTIKGIKGLKRKKERWEKKSYLIEGVKIVDEYIKWIGNPECILFSEDLFNVTGGRELFKKIEELNINIINVPNNLLKELSDTENPQGVLAVGKINDFKLDELFQSKNKFIIILDELQDPGNAGTIIRTADAFGASGVVLTNNCVDVYNPKVVRATMGSLFHIPVVFADNKIELINHFKNEGIKVYSTSLEGKNYIHEVDLTEDIAIIIGNEANGVSDEMISISDFLIKIPMYGKAESLNAAVATSVVMYEVARQRVNNP
ncbi:23S rRNA (guanosine(2251)-2'-O)-methyltransferase RlmB [Anaerosalibacter sp. Marseille-P3206]|uniref:23S rRNA (guanosine(2251)-2'-O)-methyltransferase RlmB n=1 Tax=Anaerosalibacter sp. Marseille-P3206 TaxID=1871005 RepID=UPI000984D873|nr:23S rRNA (guanosine(2251)-2'-O)-methyltransferase RlmB [Anaerosalibacter sp. Marseille-P3206]